VYSEQWRGTGSRVSIIDRYRLSEIERDLDTVRADRSAGGVPMGAYVTVAISPAVALSSIASNFLVAEFRNPENWPQP